MNKALLHSQTMMLDGINAVASVKNILAVEEINKAREIASELLLKSKLSDNYSVFVHVLNDEAELSLFMHEKIEYDVYVKDDTGKFQAEILNMIYVLDSEHKHLNNKLVKIDDFSVVIELHNILLIRYANTPQTLLINPNSEYTYYNQKKVNAHNVDLHKKEKKRYLIHNVRTEAKINRNNLCKCDSGKKYKNCCM